MIYIFMSPKTAQAHQDTHKMQNAKCKIHNKDAATLCHNKTLLSLSLSLPNSFSLTLMSEPLDVDSELIQVLNE